MPKKLETEMCRGGHYGQDRRDFEIMRMVEIQNAGATEAELTEEAKQIPEAQ